MTKFHFPDVKTLALTGLITLGTVAVASAQSLDIGVLTDDDEGGVGLSLDYNFAPAFETGRWSGNWAIGGRFNDGDDAWLGAGFAVQYDATDTLFVEASFMPGYYDGGDIDLGGNLQYRSLIGIGLTLPNDDALLLTIDHLSNGGREDFNPGAEAISLRYRLRF